MNTKHPFWNSVVANPSGMKTTGFIVYKWVWNFSITVSHSLLSCGKWWHAQQCYAQEYSIVRRHCLWHS
jgi:hypothetical protein